MPYSAFEKLTAAKLNRGVAVDYEAAMTGATLTLTTSEQSISGCSITLSTTAANAKAIITGQFDCFVQTASAGVVILGYASVNGVTVSRAVPYSGSTASERATITGTWTATLAAAGSHTILLRAKQGTLGGVQQILQAATLLSVRVQEVV